MPSLEHVEAARHDYSATVRILNEQLNRGLVIGPLKMLDIARDVLMVPDQSEFRLDSLALARGILISRLEQPDAMDPYAGMSGARQLFAQFIHHRSLGEWETQNSWTQAWPIIRRPVDVTEV